MCNRVDGPYKKEITVNGLMKDKTNVFGYICKKRSTLRKNMGKSLINFSETTHEDII